ncbi:MAG TPA: CvpA family protein [Gaiellaceae bacterium]|nr:CvpA family protein [Gaiellaceae bacterium]
MTRVDWIALGIVALSAFAGLRRGLVATTLSLAGLAAGAVVGARLAPHVLHGGSASPYTPVAGLAGAVIGAAVLQAVASMAGSSLRKALFVVPPLRALDSAGGLVAGAAFGAVLVWVGAAMLLQLPSDNSIRDEVRGSRVVQQLTAIAPPRSILRAFARIDPFPRIAGPEPPTIAPDTRVLATAAVRGARPSVVRITAVACGVGVEGSGWVARPHLIVTAAHVVAGASGILAGGHRATALVVDRRQDVAILRVPGLDARALPLANPHDGSSVAILGYPENGPFDARAGRIGATADVLDNGELRQVTAVRGLVRHGNSGGPAVDENGAVQSTIFAARIGTAAGYGIPAGPVLADLKKAKKPVSTGKCS